MEMIRDKLELKRKNKIREIEERRSGQINALMKNHYKAFTDIKSYYNDISLKARLLLTLRRQMKKKEERNEQLMTDITSENKRMSEPLQAAIAECDSLKKYLQHYAKDKMSLQNAKARLKIQKKRDDSLKENLEKKDLQLNGILKATNMDPHSMAIFTRRLDEFLDTKNLLVKELQYELAKVTKAHNDMIQVYGAKLTEFSIPVEELGFSR
ncbi:growth arrest-specific 8, isoform CRA_c [Cladochytrium replicatum]|nr:growth arrest-specific 8, isoform CRA_c [Cladochytrium replicatum]